MFFIINKNIIMITYRPYYNICGIPCIRYSMNSLSFKVLDEKNKKNTPE